jgi:anti-sigma factor RsiW
MNTEQQDQLILFWSGEADTGQIAAVEALLETNADARSYVHELDALRGDFTELAPPVSPRAFAAEAVAAHQPMKRTVLFPFGWIAGAAAAIALVAIVLKTWPLRMDTPPSNEPVAEQRTMRPKLSERLFASPQRQHVSSIDRISAARDRARKLRTQLSDKHPS